MNRRGLLGSIAALLFGGPRIPDDAPSSQIAHARHTAFTGLAPKLPPGDDATAIWIVQWGERRVERLGPVCEADMRAKLEAAFRGPQT